MNTPKCGGAKKMKKRTPKKMSSKKSNEPKRSFKVVEVDGKAKNVGRYMGKDHSSAARKALIQLCRKSSAGKMSCKHTFTIQETTQGSDKKMKTFTGEKMMKKLKKPIKLSWGEVHYDTKYSIHLLREDK